MLKGKYEPVGEPNEDHVVEVVKHFLVALEQGTGMYVWMDVCMYVCREFVSCFLSILCLVSFVVCLCVCCVLHLFYIVSIFSSQ